MISMHPFGTSLFQWKQMMEARTEELKKSKSEQGAISLRPTAILGSSVR